MDAVRMVIVAGLVGATAFVEPQGAGTSTGVVTVDRGSRPAAPAPAPVDPRTAGGRPSDVVSSTVVLRRVTAGPVTAAPTNGSPATWRDLGTDRRVHVTVTTRYYDVQGLTPEAISDSMGRLGPKAIHAKNAIGSFSSRDRINYVLLDRGSSCSLSSFTITHDATITLPRWRGSAKATDETRDWWAETLRDIVQHEQEHAFIAAVQVRAMPAELDRLRTTGSCDAMESAVTHVTHRRWDAADRLNDQFDDWTDNGTTGPYWLG